MRVRMDGPSDDPLQTSRTLQSVCNSWDQREDDDTIDELRGIGTESVLTKPIGLNEYDRPYLLSAFPNYDYHFPNEPWRMDYRRPENRTLVAWQIQAFHYYWSLRQTSEGQSGLAINTPYLPNMEYVSYKDFLDHENIKNQDNDIIICSAALPLLPCLTGQRRCQSAECLIGFLSQLIEILNPQGILAGIGIDEAHANNAGVSLADTVDFIHSWTASSFLKIIQQFDNIIIEEFDTLHNYFAFNFVLRKK